MNNRCCCCCCCCDSSTESFTKMEVCVNTPTPLRQHDMALQNLLNYFQCFAPFLYLIDFILFVLMTGPHYTSITNFMQGYIDNEINLNGNQRCDGTCSDFKSTKNHQPCQNDTLCAHSNFARTTCTGDIFDCSVIDSDGTACLVVCPILKMSSFYF